MAGSSGSFRELEDKPSSAIIQHMKWSPKMDLLAVITAEGDVWLNRLSWQQVWAVSAGNEKAVCLAWRPDGNLLCVGYESGEIKSFDIENAECVHKCSIGNTPTCMEWTEEVKSSAPRKPSFYIEQSELYLPSLPFLPKSGGAVFSKESHDEENKDRKKLSSLPDKLSILTVGDVSGHVHIMLYGMFLAGVLPIENDIESTHGVEIVNAAFSADLELLNVIVKAKQITGATYSLLAYTTTLLSSHRHELSLIAKKSGIVTSLLEYFNETIRSMSEAWEDILLEMETKLTAYMNEQKMPKFSITNEFLTLLTKGILSPELQNFLLHDLTEKGLKKLGVNIDNSYTSIQSLALKHLQCVTEALLYHMTDIRGMARWYNLFGVLGLSEKSTDVAIKSLGAVMLKNTELVEVIETSLKSFKAFFQWLYSIILRLSDEPVPSYVKKFSQQDILLLANFLKTQLNTDEHGKFRIERVGQYFEDKPLTVLSSFGDNAFAKFVEGSTVLKDSPYMVSHSMEHSLLSLAKALVGNVNHTFKHVSEVIGESFTCKGLVTLGEAQMNTPSVITQASMGTPPAQYIAFSIGEKLSEKLHLIKIEAETGNSCATTVNISKLGQNSEIEQEKSIFKFQDAMFYTPDSLTALMRDEKSDSDAETVLVQIPLNLIDNSYFRKFTLGDVRSNVTESLQMCDVGAWLTQFRRLPGMLSGSIAVSGARKVTCVLSASRRRVIMLDMDAEDEDDDEEGDVSHNVTGNDLMMES